MKIWQKETKLFDYQMIKRGNYFDEYALLEALFLVVLEGEVLEKKRRLGLGEVGSNQAGVLELVSVQLE